MNMFLRRANRKLCLLLTQSFRSSSTVLSPTAPTIPVRQSMQCGRQYAFMPSSRQLLRNICTLQSSAGVQEVAGSLPPRPSDHKRVYVLSQDIPEVHNYTSFECDTRKYNETQNVDALKLAFVKHIRPFLVSRCILLTRPLHDQWVKCLHGMNLKLMGHMPVYVTSLDLVTCLHTLKPIYWTELLNMLVAGRVMVVEDWEHSLAPIEWMVYDHGMQLAAPGDDNLSNCKAEYAASFDTKSRTATIASIIWKSKKIIDCQINHDVICSNYGEAQGVALHNVLTRGRQLGILNLDVVTDVALHDKGFKGTHDIEKTPYPHICMAFVQAAKQYKICRSRLEPKEMLGLVNDMAKLKNMELFELEEMLAVKGAHYILGIPFFHIAQVKSKIMSKLDAKNCSSKVTFPTNCYIEVPEKSMKLDALAGILSVLEANLVVVLTGSSGSASEVQSMMELSYKCAVVENTGPVDAKLQGLTNERAAMIYVDQFEVLSVEADKFLVIVLDLPKGPVHFSANQIHSNFLVVNIVTPTEKASVSDSEEVNPMLFGFFRSCGGTVLHQDGAMMQVHNGGVPTI